MQALERSLPRRFGRYLLLRPLGSGGMAEIFLGVTQGMAGFRKVFAIKCLHPHLMRDANLVKLFMDEARLAARLNHTNIVHTFDLGEHDGSFYIAMEYINGANLAQLLTGGRVPFDVALTVVTDAAQALHFAHTAQDEQGKPLKIVHRDVTPRNIMVSFSGEVKLTDFGIARAADQLHTTRTGESKGTLRYMSPEQLDGKKVDSRSDIYSLGVCLFETFTARRLFGGVSNAKLHDPAIRKNLPKPSEVNEEVPPEADAIVVRALQPDPAARYASCAELVEALKALGVSSGVERGRECVAELMAARFPKQSALPLLSQEDSLVLQHFDGDDATVHTGPHQERPRAFDDANAANTVVARPEAPDRIRTLAGGDASFTQSAPTVSSGEFAAPIVGDVSSPGVQASPPRRRASLIWVPALLLLAAAGIVASVLLMPETPPAAKPAPAALPPASAPVPSLVSLKIVSVPAGALVMVDGVDVGRTPLKLERKKDAARTLNVMLMLDDHVPVRRKVSLAGDTAIDVTMLSTGRKKGVRTKPGRKRPRPGTKAPTTDKPSIVLTKPVKPRPRPRPRPDPVKVDDLK